jgi:hypothetical protein
MVVLAAKLMETADNPQAMTQLNPKEGGGSGFVHNRPPCCSAMRPLNTRARATPRAYRSPPAAHGPADVTRAAIVESWGHGGLTTEASQLQRGQEAVTVCSRAQLEFAELL